MAFPSQQYFQDQYIFITGATGFLGSVLVFKILCSVPCKRLLLLVRGGEKWVVFSIRYPDTDLRALGVFGISQKLFSRLNNVKRFGRVTELKSLTVTLKSLGWVLQKKSC